MTRSEQYAIERSKERRIPIVLFDEAEVALFMADVTLFPIVADPLVKGWELVRSIVLSTFGMEAAEDEIVSLVKTQPPDFGFALISCGIGSVTLGVFERRPPPPPEPEAN